MPRIVIVVADAVRARFFTFEPEEVPDAGHGGHVIEQAVLLNSERRLKASDLFTESRPPLGHSSPFGPSSASDDHREQHVRELDHRFAVDIVRRIDIELDAHPAQRVVVAAGPHMLGVLRQALRGLRHKQIELDDLALDLTRETPSRLHDHLARMAFVPPRMRARWATGRTQRG
ncbi:MAG TPA: host attachment protein [Kofleriaceae bacterium]|nr:host attachment protein [Kofleriaceae bacterium]